jgi:hypothetical protein
MTVTLSPQLAAGDGIAQVIELESAACTTVGALDDLVRARGEDLALDRRETFVLERELFDVDLEISQRLEDLYADLGARDDENAGPSLTLVALLHWCVLLRRRIMQPLHTRVDSLVEDPDCAGDLIADQLLLRYFAAMLDIGEGDEQDAVAAVRALADIARQTACLGAQQMALLASALYWSFADLRSSLRLGGLERVLPFVVGAAYAPLLLIYDVEKYRGLDAPLARWFAENQEWFLRAVQTRRAPIIWHGLWLYDRRSGHLFGYRAKADPEDENDVNLTHFVASIVSPENLGRRDCSFAEMIERGVTQRGYLCVGSVCAEREEGGREVFTVRPMTSRPQFGTYLSKSTSIELDSATKNSLCGEGGGGGGGGGGDGCDGAISVAGRSWGAAVVRCLSEQVLQPGEQVLRCIGEGSGRCSDPLEAANKRLQSAFYPGIKVAPGCQISAGMGDVKEAEQRKQDEAALDKARKRADDAQQAAMEQLRKTEEAERKAAEAAADSAAANSDPDTSQEERDALALNAELSEENAELNREILHERILISDQADRDYYEQYRDFRGKYGGGSQYCPPDTPECGDNGCTGMSAAAAQMMDCLQIDARQAEIDRIERQPGVIDPSPLDDSSDLSWATCLGSFEDTSRLQRRCWAVDCGQQWVTVLEDDMCGCRDPMSLGPPVASDRLAGACASINCGDRVPVIRDGSCRCEDAFGELGGQPVPVPRPEIMTVSPPLLFSEARVDDWTPMAGPLTRFREGRLPL